LIPNRRKTSPKPGWRSSYHCPICPGGVTPINTSSGGGFRETSSAVIGLAVETAPEPPFTIQTPNDYTRPHPFPESSTTSGSELLCCWPTRNEIEESKQVVRQRPIKRDSTAVQRVPPRLTTPRKPGTNSFSRRTAILFPWGGGGTGPATPPLSRPTIFFNTPGPITHNPRPLFWRTTTQWGAALRRPQSSEDKAFFFPWGGEITERDSYTFGTSNASFTWGPSPCFKTLC